MLLADEPTGALDSRTSVELMALFQELNRDGTTVVIVTHEPDVAAYANRLIRFLDGHVISDKRQTPVDAAQAARGTDQAHPPCITRPPNDARPFMTHRDAIVSALDALRLHKLRSALTMLGIIIGVAAVIAMVAVGGGAREQVVAQIRSLGANLLIVMPGNVTQGGVRLGSGAASTLTDDDAAAIAKEVAAVQAVAPYHARQRATDRQRHELGDRRDRHRQWLVRGARMGCRASAASSSRRRFRAARRWC